MEPLQYALTYVFLYYISRLTLLSKRTPCVQPNLFCAKKLTQLASTKTKEWIYTLFTDLNNLGKQCWHMHVMLYLRAFRFSLHLVNFPIHTFCVMCMMPHNPSLPLHSHYQHHLGRCLSSNITPFPFLSIHFLVYMVCLQGIIVARIDLIETDDRMEWWTIAAYAYQHSTDDDAILSKRRVTTISVTLQIKHRLRKEYENAAWSRQCKSVNCSSSSYSQKGW